ncbi:hypothetical protein CGC20_1735 [Leishmania donovani]|uniref:C2CD3 N-terminal C2 domain-containing protein n=1 Tax=Leishmania donovani TaxID=5661 RepID=A0A504XP56_LEIDO|nr:hypothetical protein CGC20_1735 [Leishmania donovani]
MRVLYGTPLPPGLVAPTRGELRLRIDQLILDDEVINHSPLVQLFEAPDSASAVAATDVGGAETATASFSRSPNHFVVPVDYCSVGPIFWGETRPSAQGQPATPQLRRGPVTMVYPIKMAATQFGAYLERMTESPQQGVQLDVFVPSSYSGRPPVTVGRCRITLDTLQPGHPVKGWFPVMHRRARLSAAEADLSKYVELAVGKVKLTVTVEYYPSSRQPSAEPTAATKHKRHEGKDGGHVPLPRAKTRRSHRHPGRTGEDAAHPPTETSSTSTETAAAESPVSSLLSPAARETARRRGRHSGHVGHHGTALLRDKSAVTHQLLQQGLRLRAQMEAAARGLSLDNFDSSTDMTANRHRGVGHGHVSFEDVGTGVLADDADEDISDGSGVVYTSADSDEENSAVGAASETAVEVLPIANDCSVHGTRAAVELCFSNFSFAQTSLTADLHKIRINVRLSSDITTLEPSSGPLSSFVHPVPVQQPFICLLFDVCSFFEDHSKLVVEAYKVMSELELDNENDGWDVQGPRHVAKEELLGLSVIGLYRQSRAVVFRDPVADTSNENAVSVSKHKSSTERGHVQDASAGEEACSIAGIYPPHVSHSPVGNSSSSTTRERRRLRVVVYSAAELPRVAVAQGRGHGAVTGSGVGHFPIISARPRSIPEAGVEGVTSYAEPNSFVTIEEVYRVAETWCTKSKTAAPTSRGASAPSSSRQSIHNWYVDEARGGFYDRSAVAKESSNPSYNYEVTLQLPEMTVPTGNGTAAAAVTHGLADVLDELQLAVWHSDLSRQTFSASGTIVTNGGAGSGHSRSRGTGVRQQEEHFWECAAYMGTCRVDLRPLRYLKTLDGYYRVVCERTPGSAVGPTSTDVESNTIGYVRLSVSLQ